MRGRRARAALAYCDKTWATRPTPRGTPVYRKKGKFSITAERPVNIGAACCKSQSHKRKENGPVASLPVPALLQISVAELEALELPPGKEEDQNGG